MSQALPAFVHYPLGEALALAAVGQRLRAEQVVGRAIAHKTERRLQLPAVEFVAHHQG